MQVEEFMGTLPATLPSPLGGDPSTTPALSPGKTSLGTLRVNVRNRTNTETSEFVTDDEINAYINASAQELYDILVQKYGDNYYTVTPYEFATDGSNDYFDLPVDFFKLLGVDLKIALGPNAYVTLRPFTFAERNKYATPNVQTLYGLRTNLRYRVHGTKLWLVPRPSVGQYIRMHYIPRMPWMVADTDVLDGVSGWEEYVVVDASIKVLTKEESDVSVFMAQKTALLQRIESAAENRDAGSPATVADVVGVGAGWAPGTAWPDWGF
jgi:hypothetical protein